MSIKFKEENPKGLHKRYYIQKIKGKRLLDYDFFGNPRYEPIFEECDEDAEYFVLRLDRNGNDKKHIDACRKAIKVYANEIKKHLPELAKDLIEKYGTL